jgi:hypothetical protein
MFSGVRDNVSTRCDEEKVHNSDNLGESDPRQLTRESLSKKERRKLLKEKNAQRIRAASRGVVMYPPDEERRIQTSWARLMRWSRNLRQREAARANENKVTKVAVFGVVALGRLWEWLCLVKTLVLKSFYCFEIRTSAKT